MNLSHCDLCPRNCGVDRLTGPFRQTKQTGYCGATDMVRVSNIMLHHWEEPCISGFLGEGDPRGSGAVFFVHCSLGCVYCQNRTISRRDSTLGRPMTEEALADAFLGLQRDGAYNLNLVTPTHYAAQLARALVLAKERGLTLPVVWNTGGYEAVSTIEALAGLVDIYLTDFKYASPALAGTLSGAPDYPTVAREALVAMVEQVGPVAFDGEGMLRRGVLLRHLVLPGQRKDSMAVLRLVADTVAVADVRLSLMRQYTPDFLKETRNFLKETGDEKACSHIPQSLYRRVTEFEYQSVVDEAVRLGFDGYTQEKESAVKGFTPDFR